MMGKERQKERRWSTLTVAVSRKINLFISMECSAIIYTILKNDKDHCCHQKYLRKAITYSSFRDTFRSLLSRFYPIHKVVDEVKINLKNKVQPAVEPGDTYLT
uniref:Uncharacterized protein n=1 Tax=Romanomermis culicivorax TaxID=13658 RepID=A0A915I6K8_ROMCU